ncbi:MAG: glycosyltransferase family 9 protein [Candidatus Saelkia tenebricola]|nr:glycosyltransferase family 9 protein [Candidatus Saelkia tenebricola]
MKKIVVVGVNWIGDALFIIPALKAIKNSFPDSYLTVALPKRASRILKHNPIIDEIIIFDEKDSQRSLVKKIKFISIIRKKHFDKVIFFHRSFTRTLIFSLGRIPEREGYCRGKTKLLLTKCAPKLNKDSVHKAEFFLELVKQLGYSPLELSYQFYVTPEDISQGKTILSSFKINPQEKIISLHPGANWAPKRWPLHHYIKLIELILNWDNTKRILILGSLKDKHLALKIKSGFKNSKNIFDLTGLTSLGSLGAISLFSDIFISGDSGPLHIACASIPLFQTDEYTNAFSIGLYGATSQELTGPLNGNFVTFAGERKKSCQLPCHDFNCTDYTCMKSIIPEKIFEIIKNKLST